MRRINNATMVAMIDGAMRTLYKPCSYKRLGEDGIVHKVTEYTFNYFRKSVGLSDYLDTSVLIEMYGDDINAGYYDVEPAGRTGKALIAYEFGASHNGIESRCELVIKYP